MKTSVASVTFRKKSVAEIASLARRAGLDAVEWGGDVHVPPGDEAAARLALAAARENGLAVSAYGSYYRAGAEEAFEPVLQTALLLGCRVIRVWAGRQASAACAPEYHANTLTDTLASALSLLEEAPGLRTLWQPPVGLTVAENLGALRALGTKVENLHVYHRDGGGACRPLAEGGADWLAYFAAAPQDGARRYATREFVLNDSEEQFLQDAAALRELLRNT